MKRKEMIPLTIEENITCHICKKEFSTDDSDKNTIKLGIMSLQWKI